MSDLTSKLLHLLARIPDGTLLTCHQISLLWGGGKATSRLIPKLILDYRLHHPDRLHYPWHRLLKSNGELVASADRRLLLQDSKLLEKEHIEVVVGKVPLACLKQRQITSLSLSLLLSDQSEHMDISNQSGAEILKQRGEGLSNQRVMGISNQRGAGIQDQRGAGISAGISKQSSQSSPSEMQYEQIVMVGNEYEEMVMQIKEQGEKVEQTKKQGEIAIRDEEQQESSGMKHTVQSREGFIDLLAMLEEDRSIFSPKTLYMLNHT